MPDAKSYWDDAYTDAQLALSNPGDSVLFSALEYFGDNITNCKLLDIGCGLGKASVFFAEHVASVTSIDTSAEAIKFLREYCLEHGISNIAPIRMSAEGITELGQFDFVFGSFILHHIEPFDEFARTLRTTLRTGGKAFFYENNSRSSLLMWARKHVTGRLGIPKYGDEEEYPLTVDEVNTLRKYFRIGVVFPELVFFRLIPLYILRNKGERLFSKLDDLLYKVPRFRRYSYRQYIMLS